MAEQTLRAHIALDGGDAVTAKLNAIGAAGKAAFEETGAAARQAIGPLRELFDGLQSAVAEAGGAGDSLGKTFEPLISAAGAALAALGKLSAGFGGLLGAAAGVSGAIAHIGQSASDSVGKLNDAAEAVGLSIEQYRAMGGALQSVGLETGDYKKLRDAIQSAASAAATAAGSEHKYKVVSFRGAPKDGEEESADGEDEGGDDDKTAATEQHAGALKDLAGAAAEAKTAITGYVEVAKGYWVATRDGVQTVHQLRNAVGGAGAAADKQRRAFEEMGVALTDNIGRARPAEDILADAAITLGAMTDATKEADLAERAFGKSLGDTMVTYADSKADIDAAAAAIKKSGATFADSQLTTVGAVRRTGAELRAVIASWRDYFAALAAPSALEANNQMLGFFDRQHGTIHAFADQVVAPAVGWLGKFQNALGSAAVAAALLGGSLGLVGTGAALGLGVAGIGLIAFWDQIKTGAAAAFDYVRDNGARAAAALGRFVASHDFKSWSGLKRAASDAYAAARAGAEAAAAAIERRLQAL
ncbi:MAG: hypothetical protein KGL35_00345, partial [Bradyrhizobium sp.]|nr:hypothetical protein [Bradyrhizobium sp.]